MTLFVGTQDAVYSESTKLTTDTQTTVYTAPTGFVAKLDKIKLTNVDASSAVTVTIEWTDDSASTTYTLLSLYSLAVHTYLDFDLIGLVFDEGDTLKVTAGAANDLEVHVSVAHIQRGT